jgi:hypothetical protein
VPSPVPEESDQQRQEQENQPVSLSPRKVQPFQLATERRGELARQRFEQKVAQLRAEEAAAARFHAAQNPHPSPSTALFIPRKSMALTKASSPKLRTSGRQRKTLEEIAAEMNANKEKDFVF